MGQFGFNLLRNLKSDIRFAITSIGVLLAASLLAVSAFGFLLAACYVQLLADMSASAAASLMAAALVALSLILIVAVAAIKRSRERQRLMADLAIPNNGPDAAFNEIVGWLERSGFADEAMAMRTTLALSRKARPYPLVVISFVVGLLSSTRFSRSSKTKAKH